jgi:hypothetical protein
MAENFTTFIRGSLQIENIGNAPYVWTVQNILHRTVQFP